MVTTAINKIYYPTGDDPVTPLAGVFATMASSIEDAFNRAPYKPEDLLALSLITAMDIGDTATVIEGGAQFRYNGVAWVQVTPATFASAGDRNSAYAKGSGVYRVAGAQVYRTDKSWTEEWVPTVAGVPAGFRPIFGAGIPSAMLIRGTTAGVNNNAIFALFGPGIEPTEVVTKDCAFDSTYGGIHLGPTGESYGLWRLSSQVFWDISSVGHRVLEARLATTASAIASGSVVQRDDRAGHGAYGVTQMVSTIIRSLAPDVWVQSTVYQDAGGTLNLSGYGHIQTTVEYLGPVRA
jgi:hypothetical protein